MIGLIPNEMQLFIQQSHLSFHEVAFHAPEKNFAARHQPPSIS